MYHNNRHNYTIIDTIIDTNTDELH
jgi:hypothetical protein